ncbi:MAG: hypothetical protein AB1726_11915 [Planctomycetota bacterium]
MDHRGQENSRGILGDSEGYSPPPEPLLIDDLLLNPLAARKALLGRRIKRGQIDDETFDRLQDIAAKAGLAALDEGQRSAFLEKFSTIAPLSTVVRDAGELGQYDLDMLASIDDAYRSTLEDAARRAVQAFDSSLSEAWDAGEYLSWRVGDTTPPTPAGPSAGVVSLCSTTCIQDRMYRLEYDSVFHPAVEAAFQGLRDIQEAIATEKKRYLASR